MDKHARIYVAGHRGMVGSALVRELNAHGYRDLVTRTHSELDLTDQHEVNSFFHDARIDVVLLAAARVGGIMANATQPARFLYENLAIETNVIHAAYRASVARLVFFGSSCIYPKLCPQPIREEYLLSSALEPTNDAYAIAKIAGLKMCNAYNSEYGTHYVSLMPTNLYGPNDNYDPRGSHVLPALIRKAHEAKIARAPTLTVWGTGAPRREFLHVDDLAAATRFCSSTTWVRASTTWASAKICRFGSWPNVSRASSTIAASSYSMPRNPMAHRRNCSTYRVWPAWDGARALTSRTVSPRPTRIFVHTTAHSKRHRTDDSKHDSNRDDLSQRRVVPPQGRRVFRAA